MTVINLAEYRRTKTEAMPTKAEFEEARAEFEEKRKARLKRYSRRSAFWHAQWTCDYWKALVDVAHNASILARSGVNVGAAYKDLDDGELRHQYQLAQLALLFTPVYNKQGAELKRRILNSGPFKYCNLDGSKLEAVLADDAAFLALPKAKRGAYK